MADFDFNKLAVPGVCLLISFLSYPSQVLFLYLDPAPLTRIELFIFNSLVFCIWVCYGRACRTNPGNVRPVWQPESSKDGAKQEETFEAGMMRSRWCRRCEVRKPPRAHHCKACGRLVILIFSSSIANSALQGAFLKWTITARGQATVFPILLFPISFGFFSMQWYQ